MSKDLLEYFSKDSPNPTEPPKGYCPNCWGEQEYDHVIRKMYKDKQIDVNNHEEHYAFIKKFVVKYIEGIKLRNDAHGSECPNCQYVPDKE